MSIMCDSRVILCGEIRCWSLLGVKGFICWLTFQTTKCFVLYLDFHSTKQTLWLVDSWSHALGQIQIYANQDTIAQLLPMCWIQQHVFAIWLFQGKSKYITKHLMCGPLGNKLVLFSSSPNVSLDFVAGNIRTLRKTKLTVSLCIMCHGKLLQEAF